MIIVDSGVWADFFNGVPSSHEQRLCGALEDEEDIGIVPLILTEVLQGFRTDTGFERARRLLISLPVLEPTVDCHVRAAALFRRLRRTGVTVRGAVDCIVAQVCIESEATLLSPDADFARIASRTSLRLWQPQPAG